MGEILRYGWVLNMTTLQCICWWQMVLVSLWHLSAQITPLNGQYLTTMAVFYSLYMNCFVCIPPTKRFGNLCYCIMYGGACENGAAFRFYIVRVAVMPSCEWCSSYSLIFIVVRRRDFVCARVFKLETRPLSLLLDCNTYLQARHCCSIHSFI